MSGFSRWRGTARKGYTIGRVLPAAGYTMALVLQMGCLVHVFNTHLFEVRVTTGASMLPTLSMSGDYVVHFRLPFLAALKQVQNAVMPGSRTPTMPGYVGGSRFSKFDQAQSTGLQQGDLVVAISPLDPHRTVCKRVLGLPGDTVCLDPRLPPIPMTAWRAVQHTPSSTHDKNPVSSTSSTELLNSSMDAALPQDTQTVSHNQAASHSTQVHPSTRSHSQVQYITVPIGHVWLAGDNMANSTDSRHYGPVPLGMIRGKVVARIWPNWQWLTTAQT